MKKNNSIIEQYNSLSVTEKQNRLNAINDHFQILPKPKQKIFKELLNSGKDMEYIKTNFKDLVEKKPTLDMKNLMNGGIQIKDENMFIEELTQKIKTSLDENKDIPVNERINKLVKETYQKGK